MSENGCIFCKIARKEDPNAVIEYESETIVIFNDIHPGSDFHFLAVPKVHVRNPKSLSAADIPLLEEMKEQLQILLEKKCPNLPDTEVSLGFHWPPFNSVAHLHMHCIAPVSKMRFLQRQIFRKDSFWYRSADKVIESLRTSQQS